MPVYHAPRLDHLAARLVANLATSTAVDPVDALFHPITIAVPNSLIRTYIKRTLAKSPLACAFNLHLPTLSALLGERWSEERIRCALLALFLDPKANLPQEVQTYLGPAPKGTKSPELRALQLATRLATLFAGYGDNANTIATGWQKDLWTMLTERHWLEPQHPAAPHTGETHIFGFSSLTKSEIARLPSNAHVYALSASVTLGTGSTEVRETWTKVHQDTLAALGKAESIATTSPAPSVKLLECSGLQRESEAISDEIWHRLAADPSLTFADIAVLIADRGARERYTTELRAAFIENNRIPVDNTGGDSAAPPILDATDALLSLPGKGFTRAAMLRLLTQESFQRRSGIDASQWQAAVSSGTILHGADHTDHAGTYFRGDRYTWDQGLTRLALGQWLPEPAAGTSIAFTIAAKQYHPIHAGSRQLPDPSATLLPIRALIADVRSVERRKQPLSAWGQTFATLVESHLGAGRDDEGLLRSVLRTLRCLGQDDPTGGSLVVSCAIACEIAKEAVQGLRSAQTSRLVNGVYIGPLRAGAALPFKVIFLCGLNAQAFPARASRDELDLRADSDRPATTRNLDLAAWCEQLNAATDHLILSYVATDERTGALRRPSSVVRQLEAMLGASLTRVKCQAHRHGETQTFLRAAHAEAAAARLKADLPVALTPEDLKQAASEPTLAKLLGLQPPPSGTSAWTPPTSLTIAAIRDFLQNPLQGWAKHILDIRALDDEDESDVASEAIWLGKMNYTVCQRDAFSDAVVKAATRSLPDAKLLEDALGRRLDAYELRGQGPHGVYREILARKMAETLDAWVEFAAAHELGALGPFKRVQFGRASTELAAVEGRGPIRIEAKTFAVDLEGCTGLVNTDETLAVFPVDRQKTYPRDHLRPLLDCLLLAAGRDDDRPRDYTAICLVKSVEEIKKNPPMTLRALTRTKAREIFAKLLDEMLHGVHDYLLPLPAAIDYAKNPKALPLAEQVAKWDALDFGPLWRPDGLSPLPEADAATVIQRRFGFYMDAMGIRRFK